MTLGEKILQLRKAAGLSQEQLAEHLGVSRQAVSKWELDDTFPDANKLIPLSELFEVSVDDLLRDSKRSQSTLRQDGHPTIDLSKIANLNHAHKQVVMGFRAVVAGLIMLVLEFMFLPIFGTIQKAHVNSQGFYSDFMRYAGMQPMPTVFGITALVVVTGIVFIILGNIEKRRCKNISN